MRDDAAPARLDGLIREWCAQWRAGGLVGEVEHVDTPDDRGHFHWLVRLAGQEKSTITIWLSLRQRLVHIETEVMPAPDARREDLYRYLLVRNADLRHVHLAIGPEDGIYLVTALPVGELDLERLDEIVAATFTYVEEIYPTAMSIGLASLFRRRRTGPV